MKSGHIKYPKECIIVLTTVSGAEFVPVHTISYFEAANIYSSATLEDGSKLNCLTSMKDLESCLPKSYFLRVHKKYIVNLSKIKKYMKNDGGIIVLQNKKEIPLARTKKSNFFELVTP